MRNVCVTILAAVNTASATGYAVDANQLVSASFHVFFGDATAEGSVKIQASNDPSNGGQVGVAFSPANWVDIPNASASITSGASALITISQMTYRWVRAVYTRTGGGSSKVTVNMNALSI